MLFETEPLARLLLGDTRSASEAEDGADRLVIAGLETTATRSRFMGFVGVGVISALDLDLLILLRC